MLRKTLVAPTLVSDIRSASMRPQRNAAENVPLARLLLAPLTRFNEAAA